MKRNNLLLSLLVIVLLLFTQLYFHIENSKDVSSIFKQEIGVNYLLKIENAQSQKITKSSSTNFVLPSITFKKDNFDQVSKQDFDDYETPNYDFKSNYKVSYDHNTSSSYKSVPQSYISFNNGSNGNYSYTKINDNKNSCQENNSNIILLQTTLEKLTTNSENILSQLTTEKQHGFIALSTDIATVSIGTIETATNRKFADIDPDGEPDGTPLGTPVSIPNGIWPLLIMSIGYGACKACKG